MQVIAIIRVLGLLLMLFSLSMLPPIVVGVVYQDGAIIPFFTAFCATLIFGFSTWFPLRDKHQELKSRDGFLIVVLFWTVLSLFGALPFILTQYSHISITDGIFESVSGFTATGSSVFAGLSALPHAILYYRQQLQLLGGMGIIVLAVAILPMLGVGGMQLFRAETPGPVKDNKLTPRLAETAKALWYIYTGLIVVCSFLYWFYGMSWFEAIGESFSTVATGGFSIHDASFDYYNSTAIDIVSSIFMLLGGANFGLHYLFLKRKSLRCYLEDIEFCTYIKMLFITSIIVIATLMITKYAPVNWHTVVQSIFTVISLATTTGFTSGHFEAWPTFLPYLLMITAIIGGCAASTSGGIKVIRLVLLRKQGQRELTRLVHPKAVLPMKFGEQVLPEPVIQAIWGFVSVFIVVYIVLLLALLATGLDMTTAFGALTSAISNTGVAIGDVANNFVLLSTPAKWILIFAMLAGRLEIFTLLVLFTKAFWRK